MLKLSATAPPQCQRRTNAFRSRPVPLWVARVSVRRSSPAVSETWPQPAPEALATSQSAKPRLRLLSSISRLCEIQGLTSKYEVLAGRGAMMGVSTALLVELLNPGESVLSQLNADDLTTFAATVAAAAVVAVLFGSQGNGADARTPALLESVITSLTAVQRSASSVTTDKSNNVDRIVDEVVRSTFTQERIRELTDFQSELTFEDYLD